MAKTYLFMILTRIISSSTHLFKSQGDLFHSHEIFLDLLKADLVLRVRQDLKALLHAVPSLLPLALHVLHLLALLRPGSLRFLLCLSGPLLWLFDSECPDVCLGGTLAARGSATAFCNRWCWAVVGLIGVIMHPLHVVVEVVSTRESVPELATLAVREDAEIWLMSVAVHGVCFALVAKETGS